VSGEASAEMPRYRCHKEVHALKIKGIEQRDDGNYLVPDDARYAAFWLDPAFINKHNPQPGGYYVVYDDGYASFSPAKAFEEGYTLVSNKGGN
jgi:hypothetical protein